MTPNTSCSGTRCRFAEAEIAPNAHAWDEAGAVPRALYRRAAEIGILGLRFAEAYFGVPADRFFALILQQELARGGSGGAVAALLSHTIALPPLAEARDTWFDVGCCAVLCV